MRRIGSFERNLLRDADVKFGFDNYQLLQQIGTVVRPLRSESAGVEPNDIEAAETDLGPSLLTLVRLAHAAGKRLVIGLEDADGDNRDIQHVVRL